MDLTRATSTKDNPFLSSSLAPANTPDATERAPLSSPSNIQKVRKEKEAFEERINPFFDRALDHLEAKQADTPSSHLQQKIEEIDGLYEASIYSDLMEDLHEILHNFHKTILIDRTAFNTNPTGGNRQWRTAYA